MKIHEQALFKSVMSELEVGNSLRDHSFSYIKNTEKNINVKSLIS